MKQFLTLFAILTVLVAFSCTQGKPGNAKADNKKSSQADTGYTGIERYKNSKGVVHKEVEFKNGVRDGITRIYYQGGAIEQEVPYKNGLKNGDAKWYYPDGKLFRSTPYENDTINGDQVQYYKNLKVKARIRYKDGKRIPLIDEYEMNGTRVKDYPQLVYRANDQYKEKGVYKIYVEMSNLAEDVTYYRGDFVNGYLDLSACSQLKQTATTGYLDMVKTQGSNNDSVVVVAGYLTPFGNRYYMRLAIPLPYKDLN